MGMERRLFSNEIVTPYNTGRELEEKSDRTDSTSAAFCGPLRPDDLHCSSQRPDYRPAGQARTSGQTVRGPLAAFRRSTAAAPASRSLCSSAFVSRSEETHRMQTLLNPVAAPADELADRESNGHVHLPRVATLAVERAGELVQLFKLLADETRLKIIHYLMQKDELNVRTFCGLLHQSQPAVSHHLALLRVAGILDCRRDGKHNFYRLVPRRCEDYLNVVFGVSGDQTRRVRVDEAVLTYGRDGHTG
jgi:DNA-binding transcriptional ArsR family regulator